MGRVGLVSFSCVATCWKQPFLLILWDYNLPKEIQNYGASTVFLLPKLCDGMIIINGMLGTWVEIEFKIMVTAASEKWKKASSFWLGVLTDRKEPEMRIPLMFKTKRRNPCLLMISEMGISGTKSLYKIILDYSDLNHLWDNLNKKQKMYTILKYLFRN